MKAIVINKYGTPDDMIYTDVAKPSPKENEVLVKVAAVSVNDWDWALLTGMAPRFWGLFKPKHSILGSDIAGTVVELGSNVSEFSVGDEVFGDLSNYWGGFAEYVSAPKATLTLKPTNLSFVEAAAIPQAGLLALQGLQALGDIKPGQSILINGAGGGVGTYGIQLLRNKGLEVTGVDNAGKLDLMRLLGFDFVIDYAQQDFTKIGKTYDFILDTKTNRSAFDYARALKTNGVYATVGGDISRLIKLLFAAPLLSLMYKKKARVVALKPNIGLTELTQLAETGKLISVIDGPYTLENVPQAFHHFGKAEHKGKIVITVE